MQVGDMVIKGHSVYKITDRRQRKVGDSPARDYLVLEEEYIAPHLRCKVQLPVDLADDQLKPIPAAEEFRDLFRRADGESSLSWIKDNSQRAEAYHAVVKSGDLLNTIEIARIYARRRSEPDFKNLSMQDRKTERLALQLITSVAAAALGIPFELAGEQVGQLL